MTTLFIRKTLPFIGLLFCLLAPHVLPLLSRIMPFETLATLGGMNNTALSLNNSARGRKL